LWAPNGDLVVGGVGSSGNWGHIGKLSYGLQSLSFNGNSVFEMLKVSARSDGFEIEFTEPIKEGQNINAEDFLIQQWRYEPTEVYGGPKLDLENLEVKSFHLSIDRKKIFVELPDIKENRVVYFRINRPFISDLDHSLWTTESWYTLNQIPKDQPGFRRDYQVMHNALTPAEQSAGWKLLFNGKNTTGLRNYNADVLGEKWNVQNGALHLSSTAHRDDGVYPVGDNVVVTDRAYQNYEFYVEWKVASCGNSGIIYNVIEDDQYGEAYLTGPEMQILDNSSHTDGQYLAHRAGDLYDMIPAAFVTASGPNDWNRVRIIVKEGHVEHWLNGYKLLEFDMWNEEWDERVKNSKFKEMAAFGTGRSGHIVLQDHRDEVWFRNIKIRSL
jgi:cytochrome c